MKATDHMREYNSWLGARYRCTSPKHPNWEDYGGRGIDMCPEWRESFQQFFLDMGPRPDGEELDRIDNDGNYEPGNCRWVTRSVNSQNRYRRIAKPSKTRKKTISKADKDRLERIERIHESYNHAIDALLTEIQRLREHRDARKQVQADKIREEFRPVIEREENHYPTTHTERPRRLQLTAVRLPHPSKKG